MECLTPSPRITKSLNPSMVQDSVFTHILIKIIKLGEVQDFETSPLRKGNFLNIWTNSLFNPNMERQTSRGTTTDNPPVEFPILSPGPVGWFILSAKIPPFTTLGGT